MLINKMHAVIAEVNNEVAEREDVVEAIAIALLTRKNLFILLNRRSTLFLYIVFLQNSLLEKMGILK